MKGIPTILLIFIWSTQGVYSQDLMRELHTFIQSEVLHGEHTFQLMKSKLIQTEKQRELIVDENGKIRNPKIELNSIENEPIIEFIATGSIKLALEYADSLLTIRPLENGFCPIIKIDMNSTTAFINDHALQNIKEISIKNKKNAFKSEWDGYQWRADLSDEPIMIRPRFTIGRIKENNKIYIEILWLEEGNKMHYRLLS